MNRYLCPICAYPGLERPPREFSICPSCGTEFGVDDFAVSPEDLLLVQSQLRWQWLERGAVWFDPETPHPAEWSGYKQILDSPLAICSSSRDVAGETRITLPPLANFFGPTLELQCA